MTTDTIKPPPDNRRGWPKTPDGTTDWERVFEDPNTGIIPLINSARTTLALRESAVAVISMLYNRKSDLTEAQQMTREMDKRIAAASDVIEARAVIIGALHIIKDRRIALAKKFVAEKKREAARTAESEADSLTPMREAGLSAGAGRKKLVIGAVAAVLVVVAGGSFLLSSDPPDTPEVGSADAAKNEITKEEPAIQPTTTEPPRSPTKPPAAEPAPELNPLDFTVKPIYWTGAAAAGRQKHLYAPTLRATDDKAVRLICLRLPQVVEAVQLRFLSEHPPDRKATAAELDTIGGRTARAINEKFGKPVIDEIRFTPGTGPRRGEPRPVALTRRCGR